MKKLLLMLPVAAGVSAADPSTAGDTTASADTAFVLTHPAKVARAFRVDVAPVIDGVLDDEAWQVAPLHLDFTQKDPIDGAAPTERTTFQIAYDDEAIYVAATCFDSEPDKIISRLARRDDWGVRDEFNINLDPHHDHQTGYFFVVGPSGYMGDGIGFNDGANDDSWDGVWQARTSIHDQGWNVEMKIPYHVLRFSPKERYTWGINVFRTIARKQERLWWVFYPRGVSGWTSRFGHLEGVGEIDPPRSLEILPFAVGRATRSHGEGDVGQDLFSTAGIDLRYGLTSNVSLNATVNPGFGQVEADPAVLNLSVFETFFEERRPFFLEGISLFRSPRPRIAGIDGPTQLFHSRRIGRPPARFDLPDGSDEVDRPDNTTILGALKLSGATEGKTSFDILDAVTSREHSRILVPVTDPVSGVADTLHRRHKVEPLTNYVVGRIQQDLRTNSSVGAQLTAVNGYGFDPGYVGAVDGHFKWRDNAYRIFSRISASRTGQDDERDSGWEGVFYFSKLSGWLGGQLYLDARSPGFDANDLGFMNRNDRIQAGARLRFKKLHPWSLARRSEFNINLWHHRSFDDVTLVEGIELNSWNNLHNYWSFNAGVGHRFEALDDLETRGGPLIGRPALTWWWTNFSTDDRKPLWLSAGTNGHYGHGGDNQRHRSCVVVVWRPSSNVEFRVNPCYQVEDTFSQWVQNVDDDGDGEDDHFVFGELESRLFEVETRSSVAFTPTLTLEFFMKPFVTTGDYRKIKELASPASYDFIPYDDPEDNPDFSSRSLHSTLVLRWEYRPGSTLFAVWQQNRSWQHDDPRDPDLAPLGGLRSTFVDEGDNIFLVKFNRWFGL